MKLHYLLSFALGGCTLHATQAPQDQGISPEQLVSIMGSERAEMGENFQSNLVVAIVPDKHLEIACQEEIYDSLQKLRPYTNFVAVEGEFDHYSHTNIADTFPSLESVIELDSLGERIAFADSSIYDPNTLEHYEGIPQNIYQAERVFESVYQDAVDVIGVDDPILYMLTIRLSEELNEMDDMFGVYQAYGIPDNNPTVKEQRTNYHLKNGQFYQMGIVERTEEFVKNIEMYTKERNSPRNVVPALVGASHLEEMRKDLDQHKISYVIIKNPQCTLQKWELETIEEWKKDGIIYQQEEEKRSTEGTSTHHLRLTR